MENFTESLADNHKVTVSLTHVIPLIVGSLYKGLDGLCIGRPAT